MKFKLRDAVLLGVFLSANAVFATSQLNSQLAQNAANKVMNYAADAAITAQLKAKFAKSSILSPFSIDVSTRNGIVYLRGTVDTNTQYEEAVSLAEATNHVKDVNADGLIVKDSKAPLTDSYITAKIKGVLIKENMQGIDVSPLATHVETKNGNVYLSGIVDNQQQIDHAIKIAKSIKGVKTVKSSMTFNQ